MGTLEGREEFQMRNADRLGKRRTVMSQDADAPGAGRQFKVIKPWKHVVIWFLGVVLASLIPFLWIYLSSKPGGSTPSIYQMLGGGELYIIAIVVLIAGIVEIALLLNRIDNFTIALLLIAAFLFVIIDAAKYAGASELTTTASPPHSVAIWSIVVFAVSASHSSVCVGLAAGVR